jgi:hypothetical protein
MVLKPEVRTENTEQNVLNSTRLNRLTFLYIPLNFSVNLLNYGLVDDKINEYIDKIEKEIKLRSHIIQLVKKHPETTGAKDVKVDDLRMVYLYNNPPQKLEDRELYGILIELSSPLTGYLRRIQHFLML